MIIARAPLRITLGGGGTDIPAYYQRHGQGRCLAAAIDKYVYVSVLKPFKPGIYVKHSGASEECATIAKIQHPLIREALRLCAPEDWEPQIEITTLADVPAGTGLGSSSAFACALLKALTTFFEPNAHETTHDLAENACYLEMRVLNEPIGKQDAYASAFGGMTSFIIRENGTVEPQPGINWRVQERLEGRLQLYFTGYSRSASAILAPLAAGLHDENLQRIHTLGWTMRDHLERGELLAVGHALSKQHALKHQRTETPAAIQALYQRGLQLGAEGKLVGAGGGGFLLFCTANPENLRAGMAGYAEELPFKFETGGTTVVCQ